MRCIFLCYRYDCYLWTWTFSIGKYLGLLFFTCWNYLGWIQICLILLATSKWHILTRVFLALLYWLGLTLISNLFMKFRIFISFRIISYARLVQLYIFRARYTMLFWFLLYVHCLVLSYLRQISSCSIHRLELEIPWCATAIMDVFQNYQLFFDVVFLKIGSTSWIVN